MDCLAEEAEKEVMSKPADILAVMTRAQGKREEQLRREDDEATAESSATPIPLPQLDESLFVAGRVRRRLTKRQKRVQARKRAQEMAVISQRWDKRLTELSRQELGTTC